MTGTLADMKMRIADEIARDDLTTQIGYAINDAITAYQHVRFFFNESRDITFSMVQSQDIYTFSDVPALANIIELRYAFLFVDGLPFRLKEVFPEQMEDNFLTIYTLSLPASYSWFSQQFRVFPVPPDNNGTFRLGCVVKVAAPTDDAEAGNPWMTTAERLIRSRAKFELALHVTKDSGLLTAMTGNSFDGMGQPAGGAIGEALSQLKTMTRKLIQVGGGRVVPMDF